MKIEQRELAKVFGRDGLLGDVAEVGVSAGESAEDIMEYFKGKTIHLFDTFNGIPKTCIPEIDGGYKGGEHFDAPLSKVIERFKPHDNVKIYPGFFPDTAEPIKDLKFCFVNIDVDICRSTKDCWEFFYPRMIKGGVIHIQDDYPGLPGVKKATDEFLSDKPEKLKHLPKDYRQQAVYITKQ